MLGRRGILGSLRIRPEKPGPAVIYDGYLVREALESELQEIIVLWRAMIDLHAAMDPAMRLDAAADDQIAKHLRSCMRSRSAAVFVAVAEEVVIGYVLSEIHEPRDFVRAEPFGFVSDISVREDWQRKGVGAALSLASDEWMQSMGVKVSQLYVLEANPNSTEFWQSRGYVPYLRLFRREFNPPKDQEK